MRGLALSLLFHAGIIVAGVIYLPRAAQLVESAPIIPIDLVTLAETTNVRAAAPEPDPVEEEPEPEPVEDTIEDEIIDPVPEAPEPEPEPEPEVIDITPDTPEPDPEPEPEPVEPEPVREEPQAEAPAEPDFFDQLDDLERTVADARDDVALDQADRTRRAVGDGQRNTATLQVILRNHLGRCWRNSLDAPNPDELAVEVTLRLNRDGTLSSPPRLTDQNRILASPNPFLRIAGERALRAASICAPYPLPPENYSEWRQITVNFSPSLYGG